LTNASVVSVEINKQQEIAAKTEIEIDEARVGYKPIAETTSGLFFCIQDLANINAMYQYSLPFFVHLFNMSIDEAEPSDELEERSGFLKKEFLSSLYRNICRSLFEQDKPIFSMMLTFKLLDMKGELNAEELRFLITGGVSLGEELPECPAFWMS
jgi:dynein heavy chain